MDSRVTRFFTFEEIGIDLVAVLLGNKHDADLSALVEREGDRSTIVGRRDTSQKARTRKTKERVLEKESSQGVIIQVSRSSTWEKPKFSTATQNCSCSRFR